MDGNGVKSSNVVKMRAHFVDLDKLDAREHLEKANSWSIKPSFAVQSSANKYHVYWLTLPYCDNDFFVTIQRKLVSFFNSDPKVIDTARVMRLPGFYHQKGEPVLTQCFALSGFGQINNAGNLAQILHDVDGSSTSGSRHELGDLSLAAPSLDWLRYALANCDPNALDRGEWIALTSAVKQAGWTLTDSQSLFNLWSEWCGRYLANDPGENLKQWNSIRQTELGWKSIVRRIPAVHAALTLGQTRSSPVVQTPASEAVSPAGVVIPAMPVSAPPEMDCSGEILTEIEQKTWFSGCVFVERFGEILTPSGRMMNATKFNGKYGGKKFIIDGQAKLTNEPWQAATRSTLWTVPKVDHLRFVPMHPQGEFIKDELGRIGVNTYKPAEIRTVAGNPAIFLDHLALMLPNEQDRKLLIEFLAHNARFPGFKIPWAPLIQSAEGVGKGALKKIIRHVMGGPYVHFPNAQELIESGSKFNAWMRSKLFILVDEIKVDERRDMIEVLKPMISEAEIEIQGKGHDQDKEDNYSNWAFFSNYKDAIPVSKNGRRFAIFYSAIQSYADLQARGMNDEYFNRLYGWLDRDGCAIVAHYLRSYPIECGAIPMRAPETTSTVEALKQSRGLYDQIVMDAIEDGIAGFKGGFVSVIAAMSRIRAMNGNGKAPTAKTVANVLENIGYHELGRATRPYFQEDHGSRAMIYSLDPNARIESYGRAQGYE
jgi:hypothetical protein